MAHAGASAVYTTIDTSMGTPLHELRGVSDRPLHVLVLARYLFPAASWLADAHRAASESRPLRLTLLCSRDAAAELQANVSEARRYARIEGFDSYASSGLLELRACELHAECAFSAVVCQVEEDVLRAARLRETFGIARASPGALSTAQAVLFRNKLAMKTRLADFGCTELPTFAPVSCGPDLSAFARKHGFPLVLKPVSGMGSIATTVIRSDAELGAVLARGLSATVDGPCDFQVETFVEGDMFHVDGVLVDGVVRLIWPSRYLGSCVSFAASRFLGSHSLAPTNPLASRLCAVTREVLELLLVDRPTMAFHVELWVTPDDRVVFCEAACRPGGAGVVPVMTELSRLSLAKAATQAQAGLPLTSVLPEDGDRWVPQTVAGWAIVYPREGTLVSLPVALPAHLPDVLAYSPTVRRVFGPREHCTDELASFIVSSASEAAAERTLAQCADWLDARAVWASPGSPAPVVAHQS